MKNEINEVTRLMREGRLAEATSLIRSSLGLGPATVGTRKHFMDALRRSSAGSGTAAEPPKSKPPAVGAADHGEKGPAETAAADRETVHRVPPHAFTLPDLTALGGLPSPEILKKPGARGLPKRQIPADAIAPAAGRWITGAYTGKAGARGYKLYLPSGYHGQPRPLVVMLHGCTQTADDFAAGTRMNFLAEAGELLVVYPEQAVAANSSRCWNWFRATDQQRDQGEPSLIAGITQQVMAEYQVEASGVYVAGLSAGGAMAAIMAAAYPDLYAAVGVHSGLAPGSAHDLPSALQAMQHGGHRAGSASVDRVVPLILFQGDNDSTVHPQNADVLIRQWIAVPGKPQVTVHEGQVTGGKAYTRGVYRDLNGQAVVERWTIHGAGHAWSGGSRNGSYTDPAGPDASREFVRFFQEHLRGGRPPQPAEVP